MKSHTTPRKAFFTAFLLCAMTVVCFFSSCNNDDETSPSDLLIGEWTFSSASMDLTINGKTLVQYLMDEGELTESEAEILVDSLYGMIEDDFVPESTVVITIKSDGTYLITDPSSGNDDGTWELSADGKTLTLDKGTEDEMIFEVVSLSDSKLVIVSIQELEDDFNEDTVDEILAIELKMTLNKK